METDQQSLQMDPSQSSQLVLKQYQQSLGGIITDLRVIVHNIHEESGNPLEDIRLYLRDITQKLKESEREVRHQQEESLEKSEEVSKLKLEIKAMQSDYSEMKNSLFLEVEEQKLIVNRMREELSSQKELQQATYNQFVTDVQRKNEEIAFLKQDHEEQILELKARLEGMSLSSIKSYEEIEEEGERERQRVQRVDSEREKTITNYTELINKQREEIKALLVRLKDSNQGEENRELVAMIEDQSMLMGKIQELEASIMSKDQEINKIASLSKSENKKCREYYQKLRIKEEEAEDLKNRMNRYTRDTTIRESEIAELRTTLEKVVKEREESTKYMGIKWEHEIDRVLLNAELEFDREKSRLKKAAQERQQEIQDELNQKINKLKSEVKGLKQSKTKLIDKVKELEEKMKVEENEAVMRIEKLKEELGEMMEAKNVLVEELEGMTGKYQEKCENIKVSNSQKLAAEKELKSYQDTFESKKRRVEEESTLKIDIIKKEVEEERQKLVERSKEEHQKLVSTFTEKEKRLNVEIEEKLRSKEKGLMLAVEDIKKQQEDTIKLKLIEVEETQQQARKQFEKALKLAKKELSEVNEELNRAKSKVEKELKQAMDLLKSREEEIEKLKLKASSLQTQNSILTNTLASTTKQKDGVILTKQLIIQSKIQQYNNLFQQNRSLNQSHQQLNTKYNLLRGQITQLKEATIKQIALLVQQHDKMIKGYRSYIRELQDNCFTHSDIMVYVREIRKLRQVNTEAETDLVNLQSKLLTLKQVSKYQVTKMQQSVKSDKFNSTMRSLTRTGNSQGSLRKSVESGQKMTRYNNQSSGFTHYGSIDNLEGGMTNNFPVEISGNNGYEKLSTHKKRLGTSYIRSRMKKSRVGFTEIDTYSILTNTKQEYRFNALQSPENVRCVRSALNK